MSARAGRGAPACCNLLSRRSWIRTDISALGAAVNYRAIERQVQILKGMGANAIRTAHNPPAPELLDITDRLGVLVLDEAFDTCSAANAVTFSVSGPGQLVGVDNGNPVDTTPYKGTSRNAFNGKVLAIVRSTGKPGSITIGGSSSGLTAGSVVVTAQ